MGTFSTRGIPDYRGLPNNPPEPSNTTEANLYSSVVTQAIKFPTKDQAIIFPAIDDTKIQDYILALGSIIQPKHITFCSRISNNRICVYLSSKEIVDDFLSNPGEIKVQHHIIKARRLITPATRLILSNVCPMIPHVVIEQHLKSLGLKLLSPISFLRAGLNDPQYSHVLSFRRQTYISPTDSSPTPDSILINFEETSYRIFLSEDGLNCFKCKKPGHIASLCPEEINSDQRHVSQEITEQENAETTGSIPQKRTSSALSSPTVETPPETSSEINFIKPFSTKTKKLKTSIPTETTQSCETSILAAKKIIEEASPPTILDFNQLTSFLDNAYGSPEPLSIAREYTKDIQGLLELLTLIHPLATERSIKSRITRIKKKILNQLNNDFDTASNVSLSESENDLSQDS